LAYCRKLFCGGYQFDEINGAIRIFQIALITLEIFGINHKRVTIGKFLLSKPSYGLIPLFLQGL
jgi:hypothetical protein